MACSHIFGFVLVLIFSSCYGLNTTVVNVDFTSLVQSLNLLNKTVDNLIQENAALKQDNAVLKQDYAVLKQDNAAMARDVTSLKQYNAALKQNLTSMKAELASFVGDNVAFYARLSKLQNLGQDKIIRFDQVLTNVGNGYESRIGHFTAPVKGIYMFSFSIMSNDGSKTHATLVKNGNEIGRGQGERSEYDTTTVVAMVTLNVGDLVWVSHHLGYSVNEQIYGDYWSTFCGTLIKKLN